MSTKQRDKDIMRAAIARQIGGSVKFAPGRIVATPSALDALERQGCSPHDLLLRHLRGDWGDVCAKDACLNDRALAHEGRLLSSYHIGGDASIWLITEADRSATTLLLPSEY